MQEWLTVVLDGIDLRIAFIISIFIEIIIAVLGLFPSIFITAANIAVFGVVNGFIISAIGEIIGAQVAFYLYRLGFRKPIQQQLKNRWLGRILQQRKEIGFTIVLQGRLIPFIPAGIVTFYAAVSSMSAMLFFIASTLGKLPAIVLEALVAYGALQLSAMYFMIALVIGLGIGFIYWLYRKSSDFHP